MNIHPHDILAIFTNTILTIYSSSCTASLVKLFIDNMFLILYRRTTFFSDHKNCCICKITDHATIKLYHAGRVDSAYSSCWLDAV